MAYRIPGEGMASNRFLQRVTRAQQAQEEQEQRRHDEITRRVAMREEQEETQRWIDRMRFNLYLLAGVILDRLEEQRDKNIPADPDGEWNQEFCDAVRTIPEAKMFLEETAMDMIERR